MRGGYLTSLATSTRRRDVLGGGDLSRCHGDARGTPKKMRPQRLFVFACSFGMNAQSILSLGVIFVCRSVENSTLYSCRSFFTFFRQRHAVIHTFARIICVETNTSLLVGLADLVCWHNQCRKIIYVCTLMRCTYNDQYLST